MNVMEQTCYRLIYTFCLALFVLPVSGLLCGNKQNISSLVQYGVGFICCNETVRTSVDLRGLEVGCCGARTLYYTGRCKCKDDQIESKTQDSSVDSCLVKDHVPEQRDEQENSTHSLQIRLLYFVHHYGDYNTGLWVTVPIALPTSINPYTIATKQTSPKSHACFMIQMSSPQLNENLTETVCLKYFGLRYCKHAKTCFYHKTQICCEDGIYLGKGVCPSMKSNRKFCTADKDSERNVCDDTYKHVYQLSVREIIFKDNVSRTFRGTVTKLECQRPIRKRMKKILIKTDTSISCTDTVKRKSFIVFSRKDRRFKTLSFFWLERDDLVMIKRHQYKQCCQSAMNVLKNRKG